ncbi:hypothetical protein AB0L05_14825 [Nonomuraea pusilla]|uniref:hypothetical protein n=1 Tax=Nonomuraea pusilla TaxID=46177 RepID=UPI00332A9A30
MRPGGIEDIARIVSENALPALERAFQKTSGNQTSLLTFGVVGIPVSTAQEQARSDAAGYLVEGVSLLGRWDVGLRSSSGNWRRAEQVNAGEER